MVEADDLDRECAAEAGQPAAEGEGDREGAVHVHAEAARHAWVVHRRAHLRAEARVFQGCDQDRGDDERRDDEKQPVHAEAHAEELQRALEGGRRVDRLLQGAVQVSGRRDRDEYDADGEQALVEVARAVQAPVERALEHDARRRGREEGRGKRGEERPPEGVRERHGDVATHHREAAVREVDEVHHPQRHRQSDREQEQQHPVGEAVEQDAGERSEHCESGSPDDGPRRRPATSCGP